MLANVQQATIRPVIEASVAKGALVHTDEYDVYARLKDWGYGHQTVCHARGEYARDEDGDGFCEVHVNTLEGFWSLLRSWLRPHRGVSQEKLPPISASSSSSTRSPAWERRYSAPHRRPGSRSPMLTTPKPDKSHPKRFGPGRANATGPIELAIQKAPLAQKDTNVATDSVPNPLPQWDDDWWDSQRPRNIGADWSAAAGRTAATTRKPASPGMTPTS
jgi:transposase-like protein